MDTGVARQPPLNRGMFVRSRVVRDLMQGLALGNLAVNETKEPEPFLVPMARPTGGDEGALGHMEGGKECGRPMACVIVPQRPGLSGKPGWVRSSAWIWLFSSTHRTTACSGGCR